MKMTQDQQKFLQQRAQQQLVNWCDRVIVTGNTKSLIPLMVTNPYVRYAADRKTPWIREKSPGDFSILGAGWSAATSFLKR